MSKKTKNSKKTDKNYHFALRIPHELAAELLDRAKKNERSLNAQIIFELRTKLLYTPS